MSRILLAPGVVAGLLVFLGSLATYFGFPAASAILSDPQTAVHVTMIATGLGGLVAGILRGAKDGTAGPAMAAPGLLAGALVAVSAFANAAGYPAAAALISDPGTATGLTILLTGGGGILAGVLGGVERRAS